ncbi:hypothetical protein AKJ09_10550 [Labilithrix luteola]|uniref:Uncharacterized protein n=1 Tax=Labilithrix luteola TaxID=1391654 RepID=A0A0K1QE02_9BACT|nr:hypothetical protein AKJ09_10550 [Labilithrix luteola]
MRNLRGRCRIGEMVSFRASPSLCSRRRRREREVAGMTLDEMMFAVVKWACR